nr:UDP-N-acetylmuramoylalanyl-D-glutamate--2,6-diaminopimelate ligase, UDP-N-acetylmuramoyl-L-alanyl-D-glutamate--2,6-diaminopimelate ligase [uncultured Parcubacteria bacterium Rifle_16ft_4_minimus_37658]
MNAVAALAFAKREGVLPSVAKEALAKIPGIPGRMEYVNPPARVKKDFRVLVDYAFLPQTLIKVYAQARSESSGLVCVLGTAGGGRDKWKRPLLGDIASEFCRKVFITNEDPYDDDPVELMGEVAGDHKFEIILDRRQAIRLALEAIGPGETLVITGKGAEPWIMGPDGSKIPWDDRRVVREEWEKIK